MEKIPKIEKLVGVKNWSTWCFDMDLALTVLGVKNIATGDLKRPTKVDFPDDNDLLAATKFFEEKDALLKCAIGMSVQGEAKQHLLTAKDGKAMWDILHSIYQQKSERRLDLLYLQLFNYKKLETDDIATHVSKLNKIWTDLNEELKAENVKLPTSLLLNRILNTLPEEFLEFKNAWESVPQKDRTATLLTERLRLHEQRLAELSNVNVSNLGKVMYSKSRNSKKEVRCFGCDRLGHYQSECRFEMSKASSSRHASTNNGSKFKKPEKSEKNKKYSLIALCSAQKLNGHQFYVDSGASTHMSNCKELFNEIEPCEKSVITVANNNEIVCERKGNISIKCIAGEGVIRNVSFVPDLAANLLSVSRLVDGGYKVLFSEDGCNIYGDSCSVSADEEPVFHASRENNVYKLDIVDFPKLRTGNDVAHATSEIGKSEIQNIFYSTQDLWHRRLGHLNHHAMRIMGERGMIKNLKIDSNNKKLCEPCVIGKMARRPFAKGQPDAFERSNDLLEIVYSDICGPFNNVPSFSGGRYFATFIDDYSRMTFVYILKTKGEIFSAFQNYKHLAETQTGRKIKCINMDNAKENVSRQFRKFLEDSGIRLVTTIPYTPQQNHVAERANRSIVEKVRCMLSESGLDQRFWAEAVNTAVYLKNRSPTKALKTEVPLERWLGRQISVNHFKVFGCTAYTHIEKHKRYKFDPKSKKCIFVGYDNKGYRLIDPDDPTNVIRSRNVVFSETEFPMLKRDKVEEEEDFDYVTVPKVQEIKEPNVQVAESSHQGGEPAVASDNDDDDYLSLPVSSGTVLETGTQVDEGNEATEESDEDDPDSSSSTLKGSPRGVLSLGLSPGHGSNPEDKSYVLDDEEITSDESYVQGVDPDPNDPPTRVQPAREKKANPKYVFSAVSTAGEPRSLEEALNGPDAKNWRKAVSEEMESLKRCKTWEIVDKPKGVNVIKNKWVFKIKNDGKENTIRYRARLVAKGYSQRYGIDYEDTFSPVVRYSTLRTLIALAVEKDLMIDHLDVKTAFLNGDLKETIYMESPLDPLEDGKVLKLKKSLYGLKQSSRAWYEKINDVLIKMGFSVNSYEPCVFIKGKGENLVIIALWVDDLYLFAYNKKDKINIKKKLMSTFEMKDFGDATNLLGIEIKRITDGIFLSQEKYINEVLVRFNMQDCKPVRTPLEVNPIVTNDSESDVTNFPFQELIGCLMYLSVTTRPDITQAVTYLSSFCSDPKIDHWKMAKRVLRYLKGTANFGLKYSKTGKDIFGFSDASWANSVDDRKSISGYCFIFAGAAISWSSRKQSCIALSSTESEYLALSEAAKEAIFLKNLLSQILEINDPVLVFSDNQSAEKLSRNPAFHARTKHISVRGHFIREAIKDGFVQVMYKPTELMVADYLTKSVNSSKFEFCRSHLGVTSN